MRFFIEEFAHPMESITDKTEGFTVKYYNC